MEVAANLASSITRARSKEKGVVVLVGGRNREFFKGTLEPRGNGDTLSTRSTFVVVDPMKKSGEN
jgi:hypothetical protein